MAQYKLKRIRYPRRKWSRRSRQVGDLLFGFTAAAIEHSVALLSGGAVWAVKSTKKIIVNNSSREVLHNSSRKVNVKESPNTIEELEAKYKPLPRDEINVRFEDVVGMEDAKRDVELRMIMPIRFPEQAQRYGIRQGGGLLLFGPPGTGKTMLAKAIATEIDAAFYHIRPSDIMSGQVGQTEKNIALLFDTLRKEDRAVLFLDECESLVPSRKRNGSTIMQRAISQFLAEIDGLQSRNGSHTLFLIGATNEPGMLDGAMLRPGRLDTKIYVGPPNAQGRRKMFDVFLAKRPVSEDLNIAALVARTDGMTGAEIKELVNKAADNAFLETIATNSPKLLTNVILLSCIETQSSVVLTEYPAGRGKDAFDILCKTPYRVI